MDQISYLRSDGGEKGTGAEKHWYEWRWRRRSVEIFTGRKIIGTARGRRVYAFSDIGLPNLTRALVGSDYNMTWWRGPIFNPLRISGTTGHMYLQNSNGVR